jgi:hypothetical protein
MANTDLAERESDLSKKDRLVNAWAAADDDTSAGVVADVTDSSLSYAARVKSSIEEGDIEEETLDDVRDEALIEEYATRIQRQEQRPRSESTAREGPDAAPGAGDGATPPEEPERWQSRGTGRGTQQQSPNAQPPRRTHQPQESKPSPGVRQPASRPPEQPTYRRQSPAEGQSLQQSLEKRYQPPRPPQSATTNQRPPQSADGQRTSNRPPSPSRERPDVYQQIRNLDDLLATYEAEARYHVENMPAQYAAPAVSKLFVLQQIRPRLRAMLDGDDTASE